MPKISLIANFFIGAILKVFLYCKVYFCSHKKPCQIEIWEIIFGTQIIKKDREYMKKRGRPTLSDSEKQSTYVRARCTQKEKEAIVKLAEQNDLTVSDYILRTCLERKIIAKRVELFEQLQKLSAELGKSGSNINQLAHHANRVSKVKEVDVNVIETMNLLIENYIKKQDEILISVRGIYREIAKG